MYMHRKLWQFGNAARLIALSQGRTYVYYALSAAAVSKTMPVKSSACILAYIKLITFNNITCSTIINNVMQCIRLKA